MFLLMLRVQGKMFPVLQKVFVLYLSSLGVKKNVGKFNASHSMQYFNFLQLVYK